MRVPRDFEWITDLGEPVATTRFHRAGVAVLLASLVLFVVLLGFLGGAMLQAPLGLTNFTTYLLVTAVWVVSLGALGWVAGRIDSRMAVLYEQGVALRDGKRVRAWHFDALAGVGVSRVHVTTNHHLVGIKVNQTESEEYNYRVFDRAGDSFLLIQWLHDVHRVGEPILHEVSRRVAPELIAAFEAGDTAKFGAIEISHEGVKHNERRLAWNELADIRAENGQVVIEGKDGVRSEARIIEVTNAGVLFAIIDALRQPQYTDEPPDPRW